MHKPVLFFPDGVVGIFFIPSLQDFLSSKILLVKDYNDRGRGDGIRKLGLPAGGIEFAESEIQAFLREMHEETGIEVNLYKKIGIFFKLRFKSFFNRNIIFEIKLDFIPENLETKDPEEVSLVCFYELRKILTLINQNLLHIGSAEIILNYLNKNYFGILEN